MGGGVSHGAGEWKPWAVRRIIVPESADESGSEESSEVTCCTHLFPIMIVNCYGLPLRMAIKNCPDDAWGL